MINIKTNIPLAQHTYFKVGGPADLFAQANSLDELVELVRYAQTKKLKFIVIGSGSNLLISDKGFRGLVIKNQAGKIKLKGFAGQAKGGKLDLKEAIVQVDSGVPANQLIRYTLDEGLAGLESFLGLPGTIGGAIYNNSHHLGKLIGDLVIEVTALNKVGEVVSLSHRDLKFAYDYSVFHQLPYTILTSSFKLKKADKAKLWQVANQAVKHRATTQPLGKPSSGCIFKNISPADAMRIGTPHQTQSVGYLIDKAGLKGTRIGGAVISDIHANFILNDGTASSQDILDLIKLIKVKVKQLYGVDLKEEIIQLGDMS